MLICRYAKRLASASVQLFCAVLAVYVTYTIRLWLWPHAQHIQQRADGQLLPDRDMLLHQHPPYYPQSTPCVDQGKGTGQLLVGRFDCSTILFDQKNSTLDHKAQCLARAHMALHRNTSLFGFFPDATYVTAARDCVSFKTDFGYRTTLQPEDDADFPIAFNILVHHSAAQFERLLRAIYRPHNSYCVHIDAKAPESFKDAIKAIVRCFDNVFIASKLEVIVYAGFSRLQADINCMKDQLNSPIQWRYLLNMAANTYPLKTNAELTKILKIYNGANDIRGGSILTRSLKERWESEWLQVMDNGGERYYLKRSFRQLGRPPHNLTIVKGSAYGAFSRGFVKYMLTSEVARNFLYFCRATYSPDEHFWHTLHHTYNNRHIQPPPPGSYAGPPAEKASRTTFVTWSNKCRGKVVHGHCLFGIDDLRLLTRQPDMMANRIDVTFEPMAIDCLEAWHRHKEECPPPFNYAVYTSLPFIYNQSTYNSV